MRYGIWGKHVELFELWQSVSDDPSLAESMGLLQEGTGAPEGRADFPLFLQSVIRHRMRERFDDVASKWRQYAGVESAADFREHTVSQMNGIIGIKPVRENGEYPRMRSSEQVGPSFAVSKHGGIYSVTFELIVNDETDYILNRAPREIGRTSANYKAQALVAFIESNPTYGPDGVAFFHASRNNEFTGSAADPSEDNLVTMLDAMTLRRDPNGVPYNVQPSKILVRGMRQKLRFQQILRSSTTEERNTTSLPNMTFGRGSDNPLSYGIMPADAVVDEPWLNDADDYYILGNAQDRPAFIMSFLRGQQEPFIGLKDPGVRAALGTGSDPYSWEFDSIDYKVRDVFGTSAGEPVAAIRARPS
jgi:hypothetical protein